MTAPADGGWADTALVDTALADTAGLADTTALADRPVTGELLFARYAYPPNQLGYCGPGDGHELLDLASGQPPGGEVGVGGDGGATTDDIGRRARCFDGAWPYLELIAASADIADPLDARVVEAYWVGNELLDAVDPARFARAVRRTFATQTGADWPCLDAGHPAPAVPHHSFHVFAVYPWTGLLRAGHGGPALTVLDRCRIRWAEVVATRGDHVDVRSQTLTWDGRTLGLADAPVETVRWADAGRALSAAPAPGDRVALHWDWVCDRLTAAQLDSLRRFTTRQLRVTNRVDVGGAS
jgi:hypothetical protein